MPTPSAQTVLPANASPAAVEAARRALRTAHEARNRKGPPVPATVDQLIETFVPLHVDTRDPATPTYLPAKPGQSVDAQLMVLSEPG